MLKKTFPSVMETLSFDPSHLGSYRLTKTVIVCYVVDVKWFNMCVNVMEISVITQADKNYIDDK